MEKNLVVSIESNELYSDEGIVKKEVLKAVSTEINEIVYDQILLLPRYSIVVPTSAHQKNLQC